MNEKTIMPEEINPGESNRAVSLYDPDATEDFPVLKAFQQYIDAEQAKSRKRLISLGIFFGILMGAVISVFLVMLLKISDRNQQLNDRLVDFAMKERVQSAPVVVQSPAQQQDNSSAILTLTSKLEQMQKELLASQQKTIEAEKASKAAAEAAVSAKTPSKEQLEIKRLKAMLEAEKEKVAQEAAKKREAELEAYRREHYPELYAPPSTSPVRRKVVRRRPVVEDIDVDDELDEEDDATFLNGKRAIRYFDDADDEEEVRSTRTKRTPKTKSSQANAPTEKAQPVQAPAEPPPSASKPAVEKPYTIPVDVRGKSSTWRLP